jgi:hypothetical protein
MPYGGCLLHCAGDLPVKIKLPSTDIPGTSRSPTGSRRVDRRAEQSDAGPLKSPVQILDQLGLGNFERVPRAANWLDLINGNARSHEEMAATAAKLLRILLFGLTREEWDTLMGISEAERHEPEMIRKHDDMKARLRQFVDRWDRVAPAISPQRGHQAQRSADDGIDAPRDARPTRGRPMP